VHPIDIGKREQFATAFLKISPNNRIPAITDRQGPDGAPISLFESGTILIYLANKTGRFLPAEPGAHYDVIQWLMFQMGRIGPMFGQAHHFRRFAPEPVPYAYERYTKATHALYGVLDARLKEHGFLAGADYSIADIATWPWVARWEWHGVQWVDFPHLKRWFEEIGARPAVRRGYLVPS
jgi:GST-like protein